MRLYFNRRCLLVARSSSLSFLFFLTLITGACTKKAPVDLATMSPEQLFERGRIIYMQNCIACHNQDSSLDGPVGPAIKGSSLELLNEKVLHGKYPAGYAPKRPSSAMPPMPQMKNEIPALRAYLQ
jgi:mono/diheme cytochrome c family protein